MSAPARVYLDNAATSWPKPETVYAAVDAFQRQCGAPAGRSAYREASEAAAIVQRARAAVARLLDVDDARRIAFALNGTDALNQAIHGVVRSGDHVVTTVVDHNSVLRPLRQLSDSARVQVSYVPCDSTGRVDVDELLKHVRKATRLVAIAHASNVTGAIQPVAEIARRLEGHNALMLVDAAQSLGHIPCSVRELGCDLLAAPGHKGLLGPLGTGVLYVGPRAQTEIHSTRQGGTGTQSEDDHQPETLPEKLESGNHNVPGLAGLLAGVEYLQQCDIVNVEHGAQTLITRLIEGLQSIDKVTVYGPTSSTQRVGVVSLDIEGYDPQEVAAILDASHGVQVRAGLHCAPRMHAALGTLPLGGTVRFSLGPFNTAEHIETALAAVAELAGAAL